MQPEQWFNSMEYFPMTEMLAFTAFNVASDVDAKCKINGMVNAANITAALIARSASMLNCNFRTISPHHQERYDPFLELHSFP